MSQSRRIVLPSLALATALAAVLFAGAPAAGQCFGGDGLDVGNCCTAVLPNLPPFPAASLPGLGACWDRCTQGLQRTLKVSWTTPAQPFCGEYVTQLLVADGTTGLPILVGSMVLDYTRTWIEIDPTGTPIQVWRFTAKADLGTPVGGLVVNCPAPNCIQPTGPHQTAFFYGYVDYAACSVAGPWENVLVLNHAVDRFIHTPGLSDRPGVFHPGQSYAIVAPHSALQPFVPGNNVAFGGPVVGEAMREVKNVVGALCTIEDRVQAQLAKLGAGCLATITPLPKAHTLRQFTGVGSCVSTAGTPGAWASLNVAFPTLPWFHLVSQSIGSWSNPNVYPGKESAWADEGLFIHQDACNGDFVEIKYGGSTKDGWNAILPIPVVATNWLDLADNYSAPLMGPYPTPIFGSIRPTDHLIYVNTP